MADTIKMVFKPCQHRAHCADCTGAYFDQDNNRVVCQCAHHKQGELIADYKVQSKQGELFT